MKKTQAVGIDLGTTYSCIAYLNEHGQPVTIPNQEGELATPSVVFFDDGQPIVGTEALRNSIAHPERVVQHAKRFMGDANKFWKVGDTRYSPFHISGMIVRKLIAAAQEQIGEIHEAVITVPAQFSDAQRHATVLAGHAAGLEKIEMINEPVAAALCHVLGNEGLHFTELAVDQQLLVYDLGGGTLDLAVVKYTTDCVRVVAADGDLQLGGLDWTQAMVDLAAERFIVDFGEDPREDKESLQFLSLEAEQAKRSLSVRPRAAVTVQHGRNRRTYQIEQTEFESRCRPLIERSDTVVKRILKNNKMGWAHIDVVLTTGGSSRMPMVRDSLKKLSGRTLNSTLSPDQSIAHGAALYAGMLLANSQYARTVFSSEASSRLARVRQQSVSARDLGILIRDVETGQRIPHYLIKANTPLPAATTHVFGTVVKNQNRVHVQIVESGAGPNLPCTVLGACRITDLPNNLPEGSEVEVTISYDHQARVHVSARELVSGKLAEVEIIRQENMSPQLEHSRMSSNQELRDSNAVPAGASGELIAEVDGTIELDAVPVLKPQAELADFVEFPMLKVEAEQPILLCNECGEPLGHGGYCQRCQPNAAARKRRSQATNSSSAGRSPQTPRIAAKVPSNVEQPRPNGAKPRQTRQSNRSDPSAKKVRPKRARPIDPAEAEFWDLVDDGT